LLPAKLKLDGVPGMPILKTTPQGYEIRVPVRLADGTLRHWRIRQDSLVSSGE
jgi:hypothetical protein